MLGPAVPCEPWIDETALCCDTAGVDAGLVASAIQAATEYLYDRTCRRWPGVCTATVRPCLPCGCARVCTCHWTRLPLQAPYPIIAILAFDVDGVSELADVRLDNNRDLTLLDTSPRHCFPVQNMGLPDGDPGTWSVQYSFGAVPIGLAQIAAADLACELIAICTGQECKLPDGVSSVTKQGVTLNFRGPADGYTNVETADLLISSYGCPSTGTRRLIDPDQRPFVYRGV